MKNEVNGPETGRTFSPRQLHTRDRAVAALTCDVMLIAFVAGCLVLFFFIGENREMDGVKALRYFTVLSCIASAMVSTVTSGYVLRWLRTGVRVPRWATCLKYAGISSICVTFTVIMIVLIGTLLFDVGELGSELGLTRILSGSNLFMHLICPLLGLASLIMEPGERLRWRGIGLAFIPTVLYGIVYVIFALHVSRENGGWTDIYSVSTVGIAAAAAGLGAVTLLVSVVLMRLQHLYKH